MPADFIIDIDRRVVFSKGSGVFTFPEALDYMSRLAVHPSFRPDLNQIVDCRDVTRVDLTGEQVQEFARRSAFSAQSKRAFVVSSDLQFGLSRMYGNFRYDEQIKIFRSMEDALLWLGLPLGADPHPRRSEK